MANSGKHTNGSQLYNCLIRIFKSINCYFFFSFITYRSCKHLDNKHTVFGRVVGGMETLSEMERIEVDNKDRPIEDIILIKAQIFVNPYEEADEQVIIFSIVLFT